MRKVVTKVSHSSIVVSLSDTRREKAVASSPFGPVRAGLTTSQRTQDQQLTELLNCLERKVEILVSKSYEVLDISQLDTTTALAERSSSTTKEDITDEG
mgnify:CR=1 FL=1